MNLFFKLIRITKQAVHKYLNRKDKVKVYELELIRIVKKIRQDHPGMGCRILYHKIEPTEMGRDQFERFCYRNNFYIQKRKNYLKTTNSFGITRFPNLIMDVRLKRINQIWQSDITYFEVKQRFYYLTFIIDAYTRVIVGYSISNSLHTVNTTIPALKMAIEYRADVELAGLIFHSDGGGQYYDKDFKSMLKNLNIKSSMCEYAWENGKSERINGIIKNNYLIYRNIENFAHLVKETKRAIYLYNNEKPHTKLNMLTPNEFENRIKYKD